MHAGPNTMHAGWDFCLTSYRAANRQPGHMTLKRISGWAYENLGVELHCG